MRTIDCFGVLRGWESKVDIIEKYVRRTAGEMWNRRGLCGADELFGECSCRRGPTFGGDRRD